MVQDRPPKDQRGVSENDSFLYIAQHLRGKGIPVPEIYHHVKERGWFLLEDLGDLHLQTAVTKVRGDRGKLKEVYQKVIDLLIVVQVEGRKGFDPSRTHSAPYDPDFMLVWESGYFHFAFLVGYLGLSIPDDVAVIGFDNQEIIAAHLYPTLTTMELPHYSMGEWAANKLINLIEEKDDDPLVQHRIECRLVARKSA